MSSVDSLHGCAKTPLSHVGRAHLIACNSHVAPGACLVVNAAENKAALLTRQDCERFEKKFKLAKKRIVQIRIEDRGLFQEFLDAAQRFRKYFGHDAAESKGALARIEKVFQQASLLKAQKPSA